MKLSPISLSVLLTSSWDRLSVSGRHFPWSRLKTLVWPLSRAETKWSIVETFSMSRGVVAWSSTYISPASSSSKILENKCMETSLLRICKPPAHIYDWGLLRPQWGETGWSSPVSSEKPESWHTAYAPWGRWIADLVVMILFLDEGELHQGCENFVDKNLCLPASENYGQTFVFRGGNSRWVQNWLFIAEPVRFPSTAELVCPLVLHWQRFN